MGPPPSDEQQVAQVLGTIHQLTVQAFRSPTRQSLVFKLVNDTVALCPYDRAALLRLGGRRPALEGLSGQVETNADTELAEAMQRVVAALPHPEAAQIFDRADACAATAAWRVLDSDGSGLSVAWIPLHADGRAAAGLWLERRGSVWAEHELRLLESLADGYGAAWERVHAPPLLKRLLPSSRGRRTALAVGLMAALYVAFVHRVHLRVVAPCEVVAREPVVMAAPLEGVVQELAVQPGDVVRPGAALFRYDPRVARHELEVARQQVAIIESRLKRARARAFEADEAMSEVALLAHRLDQERARLALAQWKDERLVVRARSAGEVMVERPHEWRGKPVRVGERVVTLVDPARTKVRLWLPEADNVSIDRAMPIKILLNVSPATGLRARVVTIAPSTSLSPKGVTSFLAEAEWQVAWGARRPPPKIGLKGTAVLYGKNEVSVAYWLLRKPLIALRRFLGI